MSECKHPSLFNSMCASCGMKIDPDPNAIAVTSHSSVKLRDGNVLQLSQEETSSIKETKNTALRSLKKLALVLDLDHTLLHAIQVDGPTPSRTAATREDIGDSELARSMGVDTAVFHLPIEELDRAAVKHLVMKKRPFLDAFLQQAGSFCQMTIYTAGTRRYAEAVARVIDPTRRFFGERIISRDDVSGIRPDGNDKSLERIFLGDTSMAVIIDDREDVWRGRQGEQLLLVKPFMHFDPRPSAAQSRFNSSAPPAEALSVASRGSAEGGRVMSPAIALCDGAGEERAGRILTVAPLYSLEHSCRDDQLQRCLQLLKDLHRRYYAPSDIPPTPLPTPVTSSVASVADLLRSSKLHILAGCTITFSGIIPTNEDNPRSHSLWKLAEDLGAQVSLDLLPRTTHLISMQTQTQKVALVLQRRAKDVWVLHPDWLIYCRWSLSRAQEATFMLNQLATGQALPKPLMDFDPLPPPPPFGAPIAQGQGGGTGRGAKRALEEDEEHSRSNSLTGN
eukprot:CAMPEP_0173235566 /NCGR_PEP_ID=MMETSP1142-20121109/10925_1 /TAXON_ID=483371 /ORGANISM="non described non described, Strain CCMP2298" /LENGTH=506 /DNA_ID=CAMNT_0014165877 /DNA_START=20 /DNA_END=1537 /DNA_ORIENTATION=-